MNIPHIPTDNYYKFCAISGVLLAIFSIYFITKVLIEALEESIILSGEIKEVNLDLAELLRIKEETTKGLEKFFQTANDKNIEQKNIPENLEISDADVNRIQELHQLNTDSIDRSTAIQKAYVQLATKSRLQMFKAIQLLILFPMFIYILLLSIKLAKFGFKNWFEKVQKLNDRILKHEAKRNTSNENKH